MMLRRLLLRSGRDGWVASGWHSWIWVLSGLAVGLGEVEKESESRILKLTLCTRERDIYTDMKPNSQKDQKDQKFIASQSPLSL